MNRARAPSEAEVRAAGGVVVRDGDSGPEVLVVHRPRHADWSLPKGKLERGEPWEAAALREVEEETGFSCELGAELEPARYTDRKGRSKLVRWWRMRPVGGEGRFEANGEVDAIRWLSPQAAAELVDYEHDRALVTAVAGPGRRDP